MLKRIDKFLETRRSEQILVALLVFLCFLHFLFALRTDNYFSVDDFAVLAYMRESSLWEVIWNFLLHGDIFGFGKVVGYIIFKILFDAFGVKAFYFNLTFFVLQTFNLVLLYLVCKKISKNTASSFFASLIFNKYYLFYFSNIHEVLAVSFFLVTLYFYPPLQKTARVSSRELYLTKKKLLKSKIFFVLSLLSKEVAFITPFVLGSLDVAKNHLQLKRIYPYFVVLTMYLLYELPFYLKKASLPTPDSYKVLITPQAFIEGIIFYFPPLILLFLVIMPLMTKKRKSYWILLCAIFALIPVIFLVHRREAYYYYLPASIVSIFLAVNLPKITIKTSVLYLVAFLVFGGRSVFPKIAWHTFPNWQKVSINNMIDKVEKGVAKGETEIYVGDITLERDAELVVQNQLIGLFAKDKKLDNYHFTFVQEKSVIKAVKII